MEAIETSEKVLGWRDLMPRPASMPSKADTPPGWANAPAPMESELAGSPLAPRSAMCPNGWVRLAVGELLAVRACRCPIVDGATGELYSDLVAPAPSGEAFAEARLALPELYLSEVERLSGDPPVAAASAEGRSSKEEKLTLRGSKDGPDD